MAHLFNRLLLATEHSEFDAGSEAMAFALAQRCQLPLATVVPLVSNPEYEALAPQIAAKAELDASGKLTELPSAWPSTCDFAGVKSRTRKSYRRRGSCAAT